LEELSLPLPLLGALADTLTGGHDEQRDVVAAAILRIEDVIAQAEAVLAALPAERECVNRRTAARREKMRRVAVALRFEELPHGLDLQEPRRLGLDLLHHVIEVDRLLLVGQQVL